VIRIRFQFFDEFHDVETPTIGQYESYELVGLVIRVDLADEDRTIDDIPRFEHGPSF
jgi:hypothetical protein